MIDPQSQLRKFSIGLDLHAKFHTWKADFMVIIIIKAAKSVGWVLAPLCNPAFAQPSDTARTVKCAPFEMVC